MDDKATIALLVVIGTGLTIAYHRTASALDELKSFINDRGEIGNLNRWRHHQMRQTRIKKGLCPDDGWAIIEGKCPKCGWSP